MMNDEKLLDLSWNKNENNTNSCLGSHGAAILNEVQSENSRVFKGTDTLLTSES